MAYSGVVCIANDQVVLRFMGLAVLQHKKQLEWKKYSQIDVIMTV